MTTKRLLVIGLFSVALILLVSNQPVLAEEKPTDTRPVRWVRVSSVDEEIVCMKKEIAIDAATVAKLFSKESSNLRDGWEKNIPAKVENAANARSILDDVKQVWIPSKDRTAYAKVVRFSEKELLVLVVEHKGTYLFHQFYECKAQFRVPRGKEVDDWFKVSSLEKTYGAIHKGLKQGDSMDEVTKKLGKPDAKITYQPVGFYKLCYFNDNIIITINGNCIESFEFDVPKGIKDDVKKNGRNLTRY